VKSLQPEGTVKRRAEPGESIFSDNVRGDASEKVGAQYLLRHWRRENRQYHQIRAKKYRRF
jgi:hypothetical protein